MSCHGISNIKMSRVMKPILNFDFNRSLTLHKSKLITSHIQVHAEGAQLHATAVHSRLSTEDVVITVVQEEGTIDHGAL